VRFYKVNCVSMTVHMKAVNVSPIENVRLVLSMAVQLVMSMIGQHPVIDGILFKN
jgi:hypothetical protein